MVIGIIGAMSQELVALQKKLDLEYQQQLTNHNLKIWSFNNHQIILLESGIGKVNSGIATYGLLTQYKLDLLINVGLVGSINKDLKTGDIILVNQAYYFDVDVRVFNYKFGQIPKLPGFYQCTAFKLNDWFQQQNIKMLNLATGDTFISSIKQGAEINKLLDGMIDIIDMEGTAIAQVAYLLKCPLMMLKIVSDNIFDQKKSSVQFTANLSITADKLAVTTMATISKLLQKERK